MLERSIVLGVKGGVQEPEAPPVVVPGKVEVEYDRYEKQRIAGTDKNSKNQNRPDSDSQRAQQQDQWKEKQGYPNTEPLDKFPGEKKLQEKRQNQDAGTKESEK